MVDSQDTASYLMTKSDEAVPANVPFSCRILICIAGRTATPRQALLCVCDDLAHIFRSTAPNLAT